MPSFKCKICARFGFSDLARKVTDLPPFTGLVMKNEELVIDPKSKATIVVDCPAGPTSGKAVIGSSGRCVFAQSVSKSGWI